MLLYIAYMSSEQDPFNEIEKGFQPDLPKVTPDVISSVGGEFVNDPNFVGETFWRLVAEQSTLTEQVSRYVQQFARDEAEAWRMKELFVLTYRILESQAQADALDETIDKNV